MRIPRSLLLFTLLLMALLSACGVPDSTSQAADSAATVSDTPTPDSVPTSAPVTPAASSTIPPTWTPAAPAPTPTQTPTAAADMPTSGEIAYVYDGDLWLLDLATQQTMQLTQNVRASDPAWSPDGQILAFSVVPEKPGENRTGDIDIYTVRADGSELAPLVASGSEEMFPAFAPDGALYFVRRTYGDQSSVNLNIVRRDAAGAETVVHTEPGGLCGPDHLAVGPDGRISLGLSCGMGWYTLLVTPPLTETQDVGRLINESVCAAYGAWAKQQPRLAVTTARECAGQSETNLVVLDLATQPPQASEILRSTGIGAAAWSPDDRWLAYGRYNNNQSALYVIGSDGRTPPRRILDKGWQPAWRP